MTICPRCKDAGTVDAWNPLFLANYERQFRLICLIEDGPESLPLLAQKYLGQVNARVESPSDDWLRSAKRWWRTFRRGAVSATVPCDCNSALNDRRPLPKQFNPNTQTVRTPDAFNDLRSWYGC